MIAILLLLAKSAEIALAAQADGFYSHRSEWSRKHLHGVSLHKAIGTMRHGHYQHNSSRKYSAWISVLDYGADPTGKSDSSAAIVRCLEAAANMSSGLDPDIGASDLSVSLEGGNYMVNSPVAFPGRSKGFGLNDGAIFAGPSFPIDRHLIEVLPQADGTPTELAFTNLVIDARHKGGCFRSDAVVQITIQEVFFLHFSTAGIYASGEFGSGHELMVSKCFFAEYMWGEQGYDDKAAKTGIAVNMTYPDSHVIDSIFRCSLIGVRNAGGSNLFQGLHIYTTCTHGSGPANMTDGFVAAGS